jgi:hypothetical protein
VLVAGDQGRQSEGFFARAVDGAGGGVLGTGPGEDTSEELAGGAGWLGFVVTGGVDEMLRGRIPMSAGPTPGGGDVEGFVGHLGSKQGVRGVDRGALHAVSRGRVGELEAVSDVVAG